MIYLLIIVSMNVFVNNEQREIKNQTTIFQLLNDMGLEGARGLAIAINNEVIPKNNWSQHNMQDNDRMTIIRATQGG